MISGNGVPYIGYVYYWFRGDNIEWQRWQAGKMNRNICSIKAGKELTGSLQPSHMHVFKCIRDYKQTFEMDWFLTDGPATLPKGLLQITL